MSVKDSEQTWIARGCLIGFVGFVITMSVHPTFMDNILWIYMGFIYAMSIIFMAQGNRLYYDGGRK
jgi:hypothetical protein